jgi:hypothetical protein
MRVFRLLVLLIVVTLAVFMFLHFRNQRPASGAKVTIQVSGSPGLRYVGTLQDTGGVHAISGVCPAEFVFHTAGFDFQIEPVGATGLLTNRMFREGVELTPVILSNTQVRVKRRRDGVVNAQEYPAGTRYVLFER